MLRRNPLPGAIVALVVLLPQLAAAGVEKYTVDASHSDVAFKVRHFVTNVPGRFNEFEGQIQIDPKNPTTLSFTAEIQAGSVDTKNEDRDKHLRSGEFFDVEKHPMIKFSSKKVVKMGEKLAVTGDLMIRGITKQVTLDVEVLGFTPDPWGGHRAGFEATGTINRKDFGIEWNKALDQGGFVLGDQVQMTIQIEAVRSKEQQAKK